MNKSSKPTVFACLLIVAVSIMPAQAFASCQAGGYCSLNLSPPCQNIYNYLANSDFGSSCAWTYTNASRITSGSMCSGLSSGPYGQLVYGSGGVNLPHLGHLKQSVYIPTSSDVGYVSSSTNWTIGYRVSYSDPDEFFNNTLQMRLVDAGNGQVLVTGPVFHGSAANPDCMLYTVNFHLNLNGKTVRIEFNSSIEPGSTGTVFNVDDVELDQNTAG
jgi:hypothetical protein